MVYFAVIRDICVALVVSTQMHFVPGPASAATSVVQTANTTVIADGIAGAQVTVVLRDAFGNRIDGADVTFVDTAPSPNFSAAVCTTDVDGGCMTTLRGTDLGLHTISASASGTLVGQTQVQFVVGPPSLFISSWNVDKVLQTASASAGISATLVVQDAAGHPLSFVPTLFFASSPSIVINGPTTTGALGVATAYFQTLQAQNANLMASAGGVSFSTSVQFVAGAPDASASSLSVMPNSLVADGTSTAQVIVTSRDINGNLIGGTSVTLGASGGANAFGSPQGVSTALGLWTSSLNSTQVQTETITASLDGQVSLSAPVTFVAGPPSLQASSLLGAPSVQTADGNTALVVTLTLRDAWGHPLAGFVPSFSVSGSQTTLSAAPATNPSGQSSATLRTTLAQNENVWVAVANLNLATAVRFVPGPVASASSWLASSPNTLLADGTSTTTLTARLADINNNVIAGQRVAFFVSGSSANLALGAATTNAQGIASTTASSLFAGARRVVAEAQHVALNANVKFTARTSPLCIANPNYGLINVAAPAAFGAMAVADLNNDGKSDLAVASSNQVGVYWGTATGFTAAATLLAAGGTPTVLAAGDLNGDGWLDLVGLNAGGTLSVLLNQGATVFAPPVAYRLEAPGAMLIVDDFNADAQPDVAVALTRTTGAAAILLGTGLGQLGNAVYWPAAGPAYGLVALDVNQDGIRDVALTQSGNNAVLPMLGSGDGNFVLQAAISVGTGPKDVRAGDFNQDGIDDLVVLNTGANTAGVLVGNGNAAFRTMVSYGVGNGPSSLTLDDLNGDSLPDIITLSATDMAYSVQLGAANATFGLRLIYAVASAPTSLATGDFNRDGYRDVVVANGGVPSFSLYAYNSCLNALGGLLGGLLPTLLGS